MARPAPKKSALSGSPIAPPPALSIAPAPEPAAEAPRALEAVPELPEAAAAPAAPTQAAKPRQEKSGPKRATEKTAATPPSSKAPSSAAQRQPRGSTRQATSESVVRIGIYFQPSEFEDAKAAYLADWLSGGEADTFTGWIAAAIQTHARRGPAGRREFARPEGRGDVRGMTRTFNLPQSTVDTMRAAITADQGAGRWRSDSAWCGEAIDAAVAAARTRNGGGLPTPPARLPNKLKR